MSTQLAPLAVPDLAASLPNPRNPWRQRVVILCACFALLTAVFPVARACFRVEVIYSEGWNIYNAATVADHRLLYPVQYGWTTVNYPMLSFAILAQLHRLTHDYLFTSRALSLIGLAGSCVLVGAILRILGASRQISLLTGFFCLALFATDADSFFGTDDPQMFAQLFFLGGLLLYLWRRTDRVALTGAALLFVIGGSIKPNAIDIPLAVLIDLALLAPSRALWFGVSGVGLAAISVALNTHFGGPYFWDQQVVPRTWTFAKTLEGVVDMLGPLLLPLIAAAYAAFLLRKVRNLRIASILLVSTILVGGFFAGGAGVSINAFFSALLAIAILCGLLWDRIWNPTHEARMSKSILPIYAPAALFAWLLIPWLLVPAIISGFDRNQWDPLRRLQATAAEEKRFEYEVGTLRRLPGPAICESLMRCYYAGKPYVIDPFNATRLIHFGKIDPMPVVEKLRRHKYAAIQLDIALQEENNGDRFDPAIVAAIKENYVPALVNEDGEIYVPRSRKP
jgi:hypothetical protein